ncbi:MAG: DNA-processing protein DprA, partial [Muribaculaceae bacterium]|nr:DNA-processing protein DprA [Muribaculaceae bacterium]
MDSHRLLGMALSFVPGMNAHLVRHMEESGVTVEDFFSSSQQELCSRLSMETSASLDRMLRDEARFKAEKEAEFMHRHGIMSISMTDDDYPSRLMDIDKSPLTIFKLGNADLDSARMLSIVGTRHATAYGMRYVASLVDELAAYFPDLVIVSGLALGIDSAAHDAALRAGLPTVAVVAHGLNTIYPSQNRDLARRIIASGGAVISEYPSGTQPYRSRFLERNRIVATMTDAVLVAESADKGGAMSTAAVAHSYGRDLLALPGRVGDEMSAGCNRLIRSQKAIMAGSAAELMAALGWQPGNVNMSPRQRDLFPELSGKEKLIYDHLRFSQEPAPIDEIRERTGISIHELMATLGEMEFDGMVERLPGNRFTLINY